MARTVRRVRHLIIGWAALVAFANGAAWGTPVAGPTKVEAIPRYATPPSIQVRWQDVPDETRYEIWRSDNGGAYTKVGDVGQNVTSFRDNAVDNSTDYWYAVFACDGGAGTCIIGGVFNTSIKVVWPISGGHEVLHGFNEVIAWAGVSGAGGDAGFHDGVDLNRTTAGANPGDDVFAPRGGIINRLDLHAAVDDDAFVFIAVETGPGTVEYDSFNHLANDAGNVPVVVLNQVVAPGQKLGKVGIRRFPGDFTDHTHSMVTAVNGGSNSLRHFLADFTDPADRDPKGNTPTLFDQNGDGKVVLFRDHSEADKTKYLDYDHDTKPLSGGLDIHVEVTDEQGTNPRQAPIQLAYWIEGPLPDSGPDTAFDDVKGAAHPYKLYDFTTTYFGAGAPGQLCALVADSQDAANSGCSVRAANGGSCTTDPVGGSCNSVIKEGAIEYPWPLLDYFIITHAAAEDGLPANVKADQYWETRAKEDNAGAMPAYANYAGKTTTTKPNEARFPDGDYNIHVIASDLVHQNVDLKDVTVGGKKPLENVRLENYPPFIKEIAVYQDTDNNAGTQVNADYPGCEDPIYVYKHKNPNPYPGPGYLSTAQTGTFAGAGHKLCIRVRFSEGMNAVLFGMDLDPQGTGGAAPMTFVGGFAKTYTNNDTWKGSLVVPADPSGNSDSSVLDPSKDAILRVRARDLLDRNNVDRGLDEDGDGVPEPDRTDENHRIKLDASSPTTTIQIRKSL